MPEEPEPTEEELEKETEEELARKRAEDKKKHWVQDKMIRRKPLGDVLR